MKTLRIPIPLALALSFCSPTVFGQQGMENGAPTHYLNFESPQVKPIAVANVGGDDYLLACNTPANSIEVFDIPGHTLLARIPVGLEPVSVVWSDVTEAFYSCNFIGDSVTKVRLDSGTQGLTYTVDGTYNVGDEPMHCVVIPGSPNVLSVSLGSSSELAWLEAEKMVPLSTAATRLDDHNPAQNILTDPRTVAIAPNGAVMVLGGVSHANNDHFQLYQNTGLQNTGDFRPIHNGLGSLNFNMSQPSSRTGEVFIVGGQSITASGEREVANLEFGFVESHLTRFTNPGMAGSASLETRNLNQLPGNGSPVASSNAINQPMDVVAYEDADGIVQRVYVASFGTDRIAQVTNPSAAASNWVITTEDIPTVYSGTIAGPRGLAISYGKTGTQDDRIYVMCRLDNTIAYLDATTGTYSGRIALSSDPTPDYIRQGRRFLYDSKLSSTGFNSCASCHVDGRTDQVDWHLSAHPLSSGFDGASDLSSALVDGFTNNLIVPIINHGFPEEKGRMITQSLQGLVNFETDPQNLRETTNAPYHWRGDRIDFVAFGAAFRGLLLGSSDPQNSQFVSDADMLVFERFVNSIHYPPNPEQPLDRRQTGSMGSLDYLVQAGGTAADGSGSLLGMKAFHIKPHGQVIGPQAGRSCVQCHSLPEGSSNTITQFFGFSHNRQALESAALRGAARKDYRVESAIQGNYLGRAGSGIFHDPGPTDLNEFVGSRFLDPVKGGVVEFVRGLDTGTAPVVGRTVTVQNTGPKPQDLIDIALFEDQARLANCEIVVELWRNNGVRDGYWSDLANSFEANGKLHVYRLGTAPTSVSATLLFSKLGKQPDQARILVFHAVPLGTARRMADPLLGSNPLPANNPFGLVLGELTPNTAYELVPHLTKNAGVTPNPILPPVPPGYPFFVWSSSGTLPETKREPQTLQRLRILQMAFGMDYRHDAPRRIRVLGTGIEYGAVLELKVGSGQLTVIKVPIYATGEVLNGKRIWTSAVEFEPLKFTPVDFDPATPGVGVRAVGSGYMTWLFGGPDEPSVDAILDLDRSITYDEFNLPASINLDPANNIHEIRVTNENGSSATASNQALSLSTPPSQIP